MRSFLALTPPEADRSIHANPRSIGAGRLGPPIRSDGGFLLIEVIISALLVGVIVVATLASFDAANRLTVAQRQHSEAAVLAAQSQEQLRSDPASTLQALTVAPHSYTQTIGGAIYTIKQGTELEPVGGSSAGCNASESKRQSGNAFRITSTVTWPQQQATKRPPVVASSVITPPTSSGLEVDAYNAPTPTGGVAGITAVIKYTPVGGSGLTTLEGTTGSEGCVIFSGIPSTAATVEIPEVAGFVMRGGTTKVPTKEVKIAPNYTTHYPIVYNRGGAIKAEFTYSGSKTYTHPNNEGSGSAPAETVTGDTFVTFNPLMAAAPDYEIGSTRYNAFTEVYNPVPSTFEAAATSPANLFPFTEGEKISWSVYAGDCVENNPEKVTAGVVKPAEKVFVTPGGTTAVSVPTSYVTLNLYKGSEKEVNALGANKWKALETAKSWAATVTNPKCAGTTPNNESAASDKHVQQTTTGAANGGHLADPFQPFGIELELCVYASPNAYVRKYEDKETKGPILPIYLGQKSTQEKATQRAKEETEEQETETKRLTAESAAKTKRENEEATAKKKAEEKEAAEVKQWEKEGYSNGQVKAKKKAVETARIKEEATKRTAAEEAEKNTRVQKEKEETEVETKRKEKEAAEATEAATSKVTVEAASGCP